MNCGRSYVVVYLAIQYRFQTVSQLYKRDSTSKSLHLVCLRNKYVGLNSCLVSFKCLVKNDLKEIKAWTSIQIFTTNFYIMPSITLLNSYRPAFIPSYNTDLTTFGTSNTGFYFCQCFVNLILFAMTVKTLEPV